MSPPMNFAFVGYRQIGRDLATGNVVVTAEAMSIRVGALPFSTQFVSSS